jgi:hypothetical protein
MVMCITIEPTQKPALRLGKVVPAEALDAKAGSMMAAANMSDERRMANSRFWRECATE